MPRQTIRRIKGMFQPLWWKAEFKPESIFFSRTHLVKRKKNK